MSVATLRSPSRQDATLAITTDDEFRVYGQRPGARLSLSLSHHRLLEPPAGPAATLDGVSRRPRARPERTVAVVLVQGENTIQVKTCRVGEDFGFFLRVFGGMGCPWTPTTRPSGEIAGVGSPAARVTENKKAAGRFHPCGFCNLALQLQPCGDRSLLTLREGVVRALSGRRIKSPNSRTTALRLGLLVLVAPGSGSPSS